MQILAVELIRLEYLEIVWATLGSSPTSLPAILLLGANSFTHRPAGNRQLAKVL